MLWLIYAGVYTMIVGVIGIILTLGCRMTKEEYRRSIDEACF